MPSMDCQSMVDVFPQAPPSSQVSFPSMTRFGALGMRSRKPISKPIPDEPVPDELEPPMQAPTCNKFEDTDIDSVKSGSTVSGRMASNLSSNSHTSVASSYSNEELEQLQGRAFASGRSSNTSTNWVVVAPTESTDVPSSGSLSDVTDGAWEDYRPFASGMPAESRSSAAATSSNEKTGGKPHKALLCLPRPSFPTSVVVAGRRLKNSLQAQFHKEAPQQAPPDQTAGPKPKMSFPPWVRKESWGEDSAASSEASTEASSPLFPGLKPKLSSPPWVRREVSEASSCLEEEPVLPSKSLRSSGASSTQARVPLVVIDDDTFVPADVVLSLLEAARIKKDEGQHRIVSEPKPRLLLCADAR